ncbi:porin family protein [Massilia litorea]|uniref:Outer membrane beta-barrel protein n=1 Tax=Massilia litorea TaxID=2769491 RepID=A0A7L9U2Q1_9BURK|nr:porin family protein [Massilia litorea]QOL48699.1 outer membrane beta-barrel protein [Massilia litorea]
MLKKFAAATALLAAASGAFAAEPPSLYAGVDVSSTKVHNYDRDGGYGAFLGYRFNESFAVEGGYHRLADTEYRTGPLRAEVTLDQLDLAVIGSLPLSAGFDVYGRLGYNRLTADADVAGFSAREHDNNVLYGVGLGYAFTPVIHARLEVQKPSSDATRILAGVAFRF